MASCLDLECREEENLTLSPEDKDEHPLAELRNTNSQHPWPQIKRAVGPRLCGVVIEQSASISW